MEEFFCFVLSGEQRSGLAHGDVQQWCRGAGSQWLSSGEFGTGFVEVPAVTCRFGEVSEDPSGFDAVVCGIGGIEQALQLPECCGVLPGAERGEAACELHEHECCGRAERCGCLLGLGGQCIGAAFVPARPGQYCLHGYCCGGPYRLAGFCGERGGLGRIGKGGPPLPEQESGD